MSTSNGWKVEHKEDNSYTVECLDFTSREKSVTLKTADQNMTGDVNIAISAKTGSVALSGNSISASLEIDYTNNKAKIVSGSSTITANVTEGWIATGGTINIGASGEVAITTSTCDVTPKKNSQSLSPSGNYYFKNVSVAAVNNLKTKLTGSTNQPSGSGAATEFSMSPFNSIAICGDDKSSIGIKKYNTATIAFDRDTSNTEEHTLMVQFIVKLKATILMVVIFYIPQQLMDLVHIRRILLITVINIRFN